MHRRPATFGIAVTTAIALACGAFAAPPAATAAPQSHAVTVVQPQTYILELPPRTKVVLDPTIRAGETTELLAGTFGQIRVSLNDGTFTQQVLVEPQPRVIRVGTKDSGWFDRTSYRDDKPFGVRLIGSVNLPENEMRLTREGRYGTGGQSGDAIFTDPPEHKLIEVGVPPSATSVLGVTAETIPYPVLIVEDAALKPDEAVLERPGELGTKLVTTTWDVKGGEQYLSWGTAKEEITKEPVPAIVRVALTERPQRVMPPSYSNVTAIPGRETSIAVASGHDERYSYRVGQTPEGWEVSVNEKTGQLTVTPPADAAPGTKVTIPVVSSRGYGFWDLQSEVVITVGPVPEPAPAQSSSSEPWLIPVALASVLGFVGFAAFQAFQNLGR